VRAVFDECAEAGLLALALQPDPSALVADHMRVCSSVADAVAHVDAVLDCVPDTVNES
jgi:3-hydroxyisobutyrate dehydrogenase-like beta-hydroxyacid dehydrogenase